MLHAMCTVGFSWEWVDMATFKHSALQVTALNFLVSFCRFNTLSCIQKQSHKLTTKLKFSWAFLLPYVEASVIQVQLFGSWVVSARLRHYSLIFV